MVHSCPLCDAPCSCDNFYFGEACCHCGSDYDGEEEKDGEATSRSIDRENAQAINRRRDER